MSDASRRQFLAQVAAFTAGTLVVPTFLASAAQGAEATGSPATPAPQPLVAVATGQDPAAMVNRVVARCGGLGTFIKPGSTVVVKPNIGWDRTPEEAANTSPAVVAAVVALCLKADAAKVLVFDHTCNDPRRCYERSGIKAALEGLADPRVQLNQIDQRRWVPVDIANGTTLDRWDFYRDVLEADAIINLPIAKHHGLTKVSLGLKNIMGVIGGNRGSLHKNIGEKLADLHRVVRPKLTIIDATRILLRNGPQGGDVKDVEQRDTIIASADPVAADAYACTLFGHQPQDISYIAAAAKAGLGEMDLGRIELATV